LGGFGLSWKKSLAPVPKRTMEAATLLPFWRHRLEKLSFRSWCMFLLLCGRWM
jgi:hypothetical protein